MKPLSEEAMVGILCELLALESGYSTKEARQIRMAAVLHDVGKKHIPKEILEKPGKLTPCEFEIIKTHTKHGAKMLSTLRGELGKYAREIALCHHEHIDGNGYWGLIGDEIPKHAKMVSLCDVLCALLYKRAYKPPWPPEEALEYIESLSGSQFCPELTNIFIPLIRNDERVSAVFKEVSD